MYAKSRGLQDGGPCAKRQGRACARLYAAYLTEGIVERPKRSPLNPPFRKVQKESSDLAQGSSVGLFSH